MGEPQTPNFYDFGTFEPVTNPQNQLFLSLETLGHLTKFKKNPKHFQTISFINLGIWKLHLFDIFRNDGHRQMMKIRVTTSPNSWIWDQYLPENIERFVAGYLIPIIYNRIIH